jgi:hypothetical protein
VRVQHSTSSYGTCNFSAQRQRRKQNDKVIFVTLPSPACCTTPCRLGETLALRLTLGLHLTSIQENSHLVMSDQKALRKRLKALMALPENHVCSDCPERKPTWASLIKPPHDAPPGTEIIGCFCCLECSGSHRRLGVHISFVRSVNLDSCKSTFFLSIFLSMIQEDRLAVF